MLVTFLFDRYFKRLPDARFERFWEKRILTNIRLFPLAFMVYYILGVWLVSSLILIGNESFFIGLLVFGVVALLYGYGLLRSILRFYGTYTKRYLMIKSGYREDTFDKSNVVN
ncbi:hypothetical protein [Candidatus Xianfuyuplasma coldseepsis]|uniref:Uncharacterized protein n=1 Tax=Candidatus Xianfuyuplasma coldseepsis TaxID=2782163 RepID=A0A7L7KVT2_9MOLU|nr:hypothetical protein [Xianfuyuplasma coldseepsis]QMS85858.1 hypothetical protein G4Z02_08895 [Xianfuyuplasma coldseepsis]